MGTATLDLGSLLPNFQLPGTDGHTHRSDDYGADIIVVVFT